MMQRRVRKKITEKLDQSEAEIIAWGSSCKEEEMKKDRHAENRVVLKLFEVVLPRERSNRNIYTEKKFDRIN